VDHVRLYLDSNVYSLVERNDATIRVQDWLNSSRHTIVVSFMNLMEATRIHDDSKRIRQVKTITSLGDKHLLTPCHYQEAQEYLRAVRRYRPGWLRLIPGDTSHISVIQHRYRRFFADLRRNPAYIPDEALARAEVLSAEIGQTMDEQKQRRGIEQRIGSKWTFAGGHQESIAATKDWPEHERFWRAAAMSSWSVSLLSQGERSSDYFDWVGPYIRTSVWEPEDVNRFWLFDVTGDGVPRIRLAGLTSFYQTDFKIKSGNPGDAEHAAYTFDCDALITCDQDFYHILTSVLSHFPGSARPVLIDGGAADPTHEIVSALGEWS
jgi:hypothetical protein